MISLFDGPIELDNAKVSLRPLSLDYIDRITAFALDEDLWSFMQRPLKRFNRDGVEHFVRNQLQDRTIRHGYPFVIVEAKTKTTVGIVRYENISPRNFRLEIGGTLMGKKYQRQGMMKAAAFSLLEYAFEELEAYRVGSMADGRNDAAQHFLKSIGATCEGTLRGYINDSQGKQCDIQMFSVLNAEWNHLKRHNFSEFLL